MDVFAIHMYSWMNLVLHATLAIKQFTEVEVSSFVWNTTNGVITHSYTTAKMEK